MTTQTVPARLQVGDSNQSTTNTSAYSSVMNFTHVAPHGNSSDYPFRYGELRG